MAYTMPPHRSFVPTVGATSHDASLDGVQNYPEPGSILDISKVFTTAPIAGLNGRISVSTDGLHLAEANNLAQPVRLVGVNYNPMPAFGPMPKANVPTIIKKLRGMGVNYVRLWGPELHLMAAGNGSTVTVQRGAHNFATTRWDELDYLTSELKKAGIYYGFVPASRNLSMDIGNTTDRYSTAGNTSGSTPTVTVVGDAITAVSTPTGATGYFNAPTVYQNNSIGSLSFGVGAVAAGAGITVTGTGTNFVTGDIGKVITLLTTNSTTLVGAQATITARSSATSITVTLHANIADGAILAGGWWIGRPGTGARFRAIIDGPSGMNNPAGGTYTGTVQSIVVENGGSGYSTQSPVNLLFTSAGNTCHHRILPDINVQEEWKSLVSGLLSHVNAYTGVAYKDEPALALMECYNETSMYFTIASNALVIPIMWRDLFYAWLKNKYGTIAALKARYGNAGVSQNYVEFSDVQYRRADFVPAAIDTSWEYADSMEWTQDETSDYFSRMKAHIVSQGYPGIIIGNDIQDSPFYNSQTNSEAVQSVHAYSGTGTLYTTNSVTLDNNESFTCPRGPVNIGAVFHNLSENKPLLLSECGIGHPMKSRGLVGIFPGLAAKKGYSLVCFHSDWINNTTFGATNNQSRSKGLNQNNYAGDPVQRAGQFLGAMLFHRGDVSEGQISKTITLNKKALGFATATNGPVGGMTAYPANGVAPLFTSGGYFVKAYHALTRLVGNVRIAWDATNSGDFVTGHPANYVTLKAQTLTQNYEATTGVNLVAEDDSWEWAVSKNNGVNSGWLFGAEGLNLLYTQRSTTLATHPTDANENKVFVDMVAGVSGVDSPSTQFGGVSFNDVREDGYQVRGLNGTYPADTTHNTLAVRDGVFNKNANDNRFWKNLRIVNISDFTLLGITSANNSTIAASNSIVIVFATNHHNTGVNYISNGKMVTSLTVGAPDSIAYTEPPEVTFADSTGTGATAVAMITGGVVTGIRVTNPGSKYTAPTYGFHNKVNPTRSAVAGVVAVDTAPESQEAKIQLAYPADGLEGWPTLAQHGFADFVIDGIDGTKNWSLWELDFAGQRVQQIPLTMKNATQVQILLSTGQTVKPTIFYELSY